MGGQFVGIPVITSRQNPQVRQAAELLKSREARREKGAFLCEGARLCRDAVWSGLTVYTCFFTDAASQKYGKYLEPILDACREAYRVEDHVADLLSDTKSPQGVFCLCGFPETLQTEVIGFDLPRNCLVLENLQDPGNLGTVLRTAEALSVNLVFLLGDCCDPLSPKVLRASMGAVFRVGLAEEKDPGRLAALLKRYGYILHGSVPAAGARSVTEIDFSRGLHAVFIGNEGSGLTDEALALCHDRVTIPMEGRAESLNASAAATILLWEMCRKDKEDGVHGSKSLLDLGPAGLSARQPDAGQAGGAVSQRPAGIF